MLLGASLLPGVGHIALGKRSRGVRLLVYSILMVLLLFWR